mgnify:CR=1 FL=1
MESWAFKPGYPLVTVSSENGMLRLDQFKFELDTTYAPQQETFHVPVDYAIKGASSALRSGSVMLEQRSSGPLVSYDSSELIMVNRGRMGFYRVVYPSLSPMVADLKTASPVQSSADVFGLMDDYLEFSLSGNMTITVGHLLSVAKHVANRFTDSVPVIKAFDLFIDVLRRVPDVNATAVMDRIVANTLLNIGGVEVGQDDSHDKKLLRLALAGTAVDLKTPSFNLLPFFRRYQADPTSVHPDLVEASFQAAMTQPTDLATLQANAEFLLQQYRFAVTAPSSMRRAALLAIGHCRHPTVLQAHLRSALDGSIVRLQDMGSVLTRAAVRNDVAVFSFVGENYGTILAKYGGLGASMGGLVESVTSRFDTPEKLAEVLQFANSHDLEDHVKKDIVETLQSNIDWVRKYANDVRTWFEVEHATNGVTQ